MTLAFETNDGEMGAGRLAEAYSSQPSSIEVPVFDPRLVGGHEILIIHRLSARPNASRSLEVRNAAVGRYASSSKQERIARAP
mgnify:CR=1 FL=1